LRQDSENPWGAAFSQQGVSAPRIEQQEGALARAGTSRIPRPFLAGAAAAKHEEIGELIGKKFHALLVKA
jgi:hypothetical protein